MNNRIRPRFSLGVIVLSVLVLVIASACAADSGDDSSFVSGELDYTGEFSEGPTARFDAGYGMTAEQFDDLERKNFAAGGVAATPVPVVRERGGSPPTNATSDSDGQFLVDPTGDALQSSSGSSLASIENEIAAATDGRVIIRTADLNVTVNNVTQAMDDISNITTSAGGWVVTSVQPRNYQGTISIRVPADRFDDVIEQLSDLAVKVKSVSTRSEDFTEEFTDVTARAQTLRDTLNTLRTLYDRATTVEDAITIQKEITSVQSDLEALEARLNFLSQSSAFSFISVSLESLPAELSIDGGEDVTAAVGHPVTYRVKFTPPEDIDEFLITWNFGDGTFEQTTDRVAPTGNGEELISSPIVHFFDRDEDSPFIVTVEIRGTGDAGLAEGEDTLVTTVSRLPVIEVFAGENQVVESGSKVEFTASFTRPEGVSDIKYSWNFGDGSAPVESSIGLAEDSGKVNTVHTYQNFRPNPYVVVLTVTGQTEVGEVEAKGELLVFVRETIGVSAAELDAGNTTRDAVRTLQSIGVILVSAGLWILILSPAWLVGGAIVFLLIRRRGAIRIPRRGMKKK